MHRRNASINRSCAAIPLIAHQNRMPNQNSTYSPLPRKGLLDEESCRSSTKHFLPMPSSTLLILRRSAKRSLEGRTMFMQSSRLASHLGQPSSLSLREFFARWGSLGPSGTGRGDGAPSSAASLKMCTHRCDAWRPPARRRGDFWRSGPRFRSAQVKRTLTAVLPAQDRSVQGRGPEASRVRGCVTPPAGAAPSR